ncbi:MAG: hypothetical protein JSV24_09905 [Bacteroidales bacterium]|nr:MAG: hypothetical protein JSV24_09905 [Bacteroidales bacterium]
MIFNFFDNLPFYGRWVIGGQYTYSYLPEPFYALSDNKDFMSIMNRVDFIVSAYRNLSVGMDRICPKYRMASDNNL